MKTHVSILLALLLVAALMSVRSAAHAQITPWPVVVTMTGPATAVSGQQITYLVQYRFTNPDTISGTDIVINIPQDTTYVSSQVVSGPAGTFVGETDGFVRWGFRGTAAETEGEVALTVRIGDTFVGLIHGGCYIPGTETFNPESRCSMETQVFAPGTLPETGGGGSVASVSRQENACGRPREPGEVAILGHTTPAVDQGTVRIPELDLTSEIMAGCFEFRNLVLPQDPMLLSLELEVDGFQPTTWANWILLGTGSSPNFTPSLKVGNEPQIFDLCPDLLATAPEELSAAQMPHAQLCAQLPGTLPRTGSGGAAAGSGSPVGPALLALALAGAALVLAGAAARHARRAR